jgi:hypothetical protein
MSALRQEFHTAGFAVANQVLMSEEVDLLRKQVDGYFRSRRIDCRLGGVSSHSVSDYPDICWIFGHQGIVRAAKEILDTDELLLVEAGFSKNIVNGWHKDVGFGVFEDGGYFECVPFGRDDCRICKVAIYLEDHIGSECGLAVRHASHGTDSLQEGEIQRVRTRAGDVILFDARLTHRGQDYDPFRERVQGIRERSARLLGRALLPDFAWNELEYLAESRLYTRSPARRGVFFAYGVVNERTRSFGKRVLEREARRSPEGSTFRVPEEVAARLRTVDVRVMDPLPGQP